MATTEAARFVCAECGEEVEQITSTEDMLQDLVETFGDPIPDDEVDVLCGPCYQVLMEKLG